jgi:hypothetical protein
MGLFGRRRLPTKDALVEPIRDGEAIEFDDEEREAIGDRADEAGELFKDVYFETNVARAIDDVFVAGEALKKVAERRMHRGDFAGAASTAIKLVGVNGTDQNAWLVLADVHIQYGDLLRGQRFIEHADRVGKKVWKSREVEETAQPFRDKIALRLEGFSGDEEEVTLLQLAVSCVRFGIEGAGGTLHDALETARANGRLSAIEKSGIPARLRKRLGVKR